MLRTWGTFDTLVDSPHELLIASETTGTKPIPGTTPRSRQYNHHLEFDKKINRELYSRPEWSICRTWPKLQILIRSQKQISFVQIGTGLLVRNRMRRWCSSQLFAPGMQQLGFGRKKIKPTPATRMSGAAKRRAECIRSALDSASKPALTGSSPAAKRRAEAFHVGFF